MQAVKRFTMPLEVKKLDGRHVLCDLTLEIPIGSYDMREDSFWTSLLRSLGKRDRNWIIRWEEELDSLRGGRQGALPF
jgi:hypothetical protein